MRESAADPSAPARSCAACPVTAQLLLALTAGLFAWICLQRYHPAFQVPAEYHIVDIGAPDEKVAAFERQQALADQRNATLFTAVLGGSVAAAMALARCSGG
jgi:hypothetical protein